MTIQRTMPGARRTLVQRPDQVPAQARQAHRLRRPGLSQRLEPGQHALLRQHQPRRPVAQVLRELRALPHPERLDALRHPLNQRLHVLGAVQLTGCDVDTLQRPAQRVHRRLELIESLNGLGTLAPRARQCAFGFAPAHLVARAYLAQSPQRLSLALNRPIGAPLQTPAHLVHLVEHMKTIVALLRMRKHLAHPRGNPTSPHPSQPPTAPAPAPDPREATPPTHPHRASHSTTTRTDTPSRGPLRPAPARPG